MHAIANRESRQFESGPVLQVFQKGDPKMHHKRGRPKNRRSGCLMCKPNKQNGWAKNKNLGHAGFGKIRREIAAQSDLKEI